MALKDKTHWKSMSTREMVWRDSLIPTGSMGEDMTRSYALLMNGAASVEGEEGKARIVSHQRSNSRFPTENDPSEDGEREGLVEGLSNCALDTEEAMRSKHSMMSARKSVDAVISKEFRAELLARLEGVGRQARQLNDARHSSASAISLEKTNVGRSERKEMIIRSDIEQGANKGGVQWRVSEHLDLRTIASGVYVKVRSADMPMNMQLHAVQLAKEVLERPGRLSLMETARTLKKVTVK